jgi:putative ABC transport system permease protein
MESDFRQAFRSLARAPLLSGLTVLILGFGTGTNAAVFSFVNALLFRPFPFPDLDRLVHVWESHPQEGRAGRAALGDRYPMTIADALDVRSEATAFEEIAAYRYHDYTLVSGGDPERVRGVSTTASFFEVLGAQPALGRPVVAEDGAEGAAAVAVLSHGYWKRRFATDRVVLGRSLLIDGRAHTIVGVMPKGFGFPLGGVEVWTALAFDASQRTERSQLALTVLGRLKKGATILSAQGEMDALSEHLAETYPATNTGRRFQLVRLRDQQAGFITPFAAAFQGAAAFVLLIACVNVGAVLGARALGRRRELAVKAALGAGRWRIARPLLAESVLLSAAGGLAALWFASMGIETIRRSVPQEITEWVAGWSAIRLDAAAIGFGVAAVALTAMATALLPVVGAGRLQVASSLHEGARGTSPARRRSLTLLVVGETAAALVLVIGAALMIRGFSRLMDVYGTLRPEGVLVMEVRLPETRYPDPARLRDYCTRTLDGVRAVLGIDSAAVVSQIPGDLGPMPSGEVEIRGRSTADDRDLPVVDVQTISPQYFQALGVGMAGGRAFDESDGEGAAPVAVVSESMARRLWAGLDPIGQEVRLRRGDPAKPWRRVVGVVRDVPQYFFDREPRATVYLPFSQAPRRRFVLVARTSSETSAVAVPMRARIAAVDPALPLEELRALATVIDVAMAFLRLAAGLLALPGLVATVLSALGVYGVFAHDVARRQQEIGVRVALGADRRSILTLVLRRVLRLSALGLAVGSLAAFALTRAMAARLFGIVEPDVAMAAGLAALLLGLAVLAGYLPARRAMRLDPVTVLRAE